MLHHNSCPLCKSTDILLLHHCRDYLFSNSEFDVFRCSGCRFVFTRDYPEEENAGMYYDSPEYISHTDSSNSLFDKIYQAARNIMLRKKRRLVSSSTGLIKGKLLDIGSGTGHFLNEMKKASWNVTGIEINDKAREYSANLFGLNTMPPGETGNLKDSDFDCVTLWHVAEHIYDLHGQFREIRRIVKANGKVVVALPNCGSFDSSFYGPDWAAWDVPRHLWHFDPFTFKDFAARAGFRVISNSTLPLDIFYISMLSEKNLKHRGAAIRGILIGVFFSILTLFNRMKASSLVYILEKVDQ